MKRLIALLAILLSFPSAAQEKSPSAKLAPIKHIIVFFLENHSFDNLFGTFPGADGIANAGDKAIQRDATGEPYKTLPRVMDGIFEDWRFPKDLPNKPFLITQYAPIDDPIGDPVHRFYQLQEQINGGKMDQFARVSNVGGLVMGYYEEKDSPLWEYARRYTLADHFFTAAFGGSMLNHFWLICACTPRFDDAPESELATVDDKGEIMKDGSVSADGYVINTIQPFSPPFNLAEKDPAKRLPPLDLLTIGERLDERMLDWAWYGSGWKNALADKPDRTFMHHHQPFIYFRAYGPYMPGREKHLKDEDDFVEAIEKGTLPAVSFFKPIGKDNLHPGYSNLKQSQEHIFDLVKKIEQSSLWPHTLIVVTFDDAGGFWDHVPPPKGDRFGPGERVPALIISPVAKKGFIDHTVYDTTSILKLIETKYDLKPLGDRDAKANDMTNALE